jgi:hypothetical protein
MATMESGRDLAGLAFTIAEIASATSDGDTGRRLVALVGRLLTESGLPPDGSLPSGWGAATPGHS